MSGASGGESTSTTLLDACRGGARAPLEELHGFLRGVLERWAKRVRRAGTPDFEEFFNECWLRIQVAITKGADRRPFRPWVGGMARNVLLELQRGRTPIGGTSAADPDVLVPDPLERVFEEEWQRELRTRALELTRARTADDRAFRAFVMRELEQCSYEEITAMLGLDASEESKGALHRQVHRVRKTFEECLRLVFARMD